MAFEKDKPAGNSLIAQGDNTIRENQNALQAALNAEHLFVDADGAQQTGRHRFALDADVPTAVPNPIDGTIAFDSTIRPDGALVRYDGADWVAMDCGAADLPRTDEQDAEFTASQVAVWEQILPAANELVPLFDGSPAQFATLFASTLIKFPTGVPPLERNTTVALQLGNGAAGVVLTWEAGYVFQNGLVPVYDGAAAALNLIYLTLLQNGSILVTSIPSIAPEI